MGNTCQKPANINPAPPTADQKLTAPTAATSITQVLNLLAVQPSSQKSFHFFFKTIDIDKNGIISLNEFIEYLSLSPNYTPFVKRIFNLLDYNKSNGRSNGEGSLDATEFTVGLFNLCLMTRETLHNFMFELYDTVRDGYLYTNQIFTMISETMEQTATHTHAHSHSRSNDNKDVQTQLIVDSLFKAMDNDSSGSISKAEFMYGEDKFISLFKPIYLIQLTFRTKCMGTKFWEHEYTRIKAILETENVSNVVDLLAIRFTIAAEDERVEDLKRRGITGDLDKKERIAKKKSERLSKIKKFDQQLEATVPIEFDDDVNANEFKPVRRGSINTTTSFANENDGAPMFGGEYDKLQKEKEKKKRRESKIEHSHSGKKRGSVIEMSKSKGNSNNNFAVRHKDELGGLR